MNVIGSTLQLAIKFKQLTGLSVGPLETKCRCEGLVSNKEYVAEHNVFSIFRGGKKNSEFKETEEETVNSRSRPPGMNERS